MSSKKSPEAFRTISEVADWLGVPTHVLRFWESRFSQVKPVKRAGGRRYYRPSDMELLGGIRKLLHDDGMTIRGVQKLLREEGVKHVSALSPGIEEPVTKDVTPSNVIELERAQDGREPDAADEAAPRDAADDIAAVAQEPEPEPAPEPEPEPEVAPEPPDEMPEPAPEIPEAPEEVDEPPAEIPEPTPEELPATGFDSREIEAVSGDDADDPFASPERMDFFAHDAEVAPPEPEPADDADEDSPWDSLEEAFGGPQDMPTEPEAETEPPADEPAPAAAAPEAPAGIDISHIPDDPPDEDDGHAAIAPPVAARLRALRGGGIAADHGDALRMQLARLEALRARMETARRPGGAAR